MDPNIATFPSWAHTKLQSIYADAKIAADLSIQHLKKNSYEYYMQLKYLVDKPFIVRSMYRRIDPTLAWDDQEKDTVVGESPRREGAYFAVISDLPCEYIHRKMT